VSAAAEGAELQARRLLWRCRRGMKELDMMLERFVRGRSAEATGEERRALEELLRLPDPVLADYLLGAEVPAQAALAHLVAQIRTYVD
jgi:antitoxin CptB